MAHDETACQTPLVGGQVTLTFEAGLVPRAVNFVFYAPDTQRWVHTEDASVWHVPLLPPGASFLASNGSRWASVSSANSKTALHLHHHPLTLSCAVTSVPLHASANASPGVAPGFTPSCCVRFAAFPPAGPSPPPSLPPLLLHWGVVPRGGRAGVWAIPPRSGWPSGSRLSPSGCALQTPLRPLPTEPGRVGADVRVSSNAASLGFVLKEDAGTRL